jgi:spore coat polysaccharide biosynthesis protein SpsF
MSNPSLKMVACLAVRNTGLRLYGKPMQNLNIEAGLSILEHLVKSLAQLDDLDDCVLCISEGTENRGFVEFAEANNIQYVVGDEDDVLERLILGCEKVGADVVFRITSESPFPDLNAVGAAYARFQEESLDALFLDDTIDGCGFEIIRYDALKKSHVDGEDRHRSEMCSLYIRENRDKFSVELMNPEAELQRKDLRLTVDYPEDLIVCRAVYEEFKEELPFVDLKKVVRFLDTREDLKTLIAPFTEEGYRTMYL